MCSNSLEAIVRPSSTRLSTRGPLNEPSIGRQVSNRLESGLQQCQPAVVSRHCYPFKSHHCSGRERERGVGPVSPNGQSLDRCRRRS